MYALVCRKLSKQLSRLGLSLLLIVPSITFGATFGLDFLVNGFGTVCASKSDLLKYTNAYIPYYPFPTQLGTVNPYVSTVEYEPTYAGAGRRWDFLPNSKFGLQFTALFNDKFKAVTQIVGRGETMNNDHFYVRMEWAYLQYNATNDLDFQFGRFRLPSFYYSDYLEVNHAQPWVAPPEEVYYIVANSFENMDGIKARYSYYLGDWAFNTKLWYGSMNESLYILNQDIYVSVRDVIGGNLQLENDRITLQGSLMRAIYNTPLNSGLAGIVSATQTIAGTFPAAQQLASMLPTTDMSIIYVGLAAAARISDNFDFLAERASIMSRGIISTAREGWYAALTYSLNQYALTLTYGFTRPLQTEINKYNAVADFFNSPQYINNIDKSSGAGQAAVNLYQSYLGEQKSLSLDGRYDILPSLSLKGEVKLLWPVGQSGRAIKYLFNRVQTSHHVWVYRLSFDFVF